MKRTLTLALTLVFLFSPTGHRTQLTDAQAWQPVSGPTGGSVAALALSPNYSADHTVFAGIRGRGVYRTIDGGYSWRPVSPTSWDSIDVAISPAYATDRTVFAAVGFWPVGFNVYRSADEGVSWQAPDVTPYPYGLQNVVGLRVSTHFAVDRTLYALGATETYRSTDGGVTFVKADGWFATHQVVDVAFSPGYATDRTLFALAQGEGVYKSSDGGATWGLTGLSGDFSTLAISPEYADDQMVAAVSGTDGRLYISTDRGVSWSARLLQLGAGGRHTLLFSPTFARDRILLAASSVDPGAYRSIDGGATWLPTGWYDPAQAYRGGFVGGSVFALALSPDTAYDATAFAGTSSGIYLSSNRGENWYQRNNGLPRLTVRTIAAAPGEPSTLLAGTSFFEHVNSDSPIEIDGNLQLSNDGGQTWRDVSGRLDRVQRVAFSPDFVNDRIAFATTGYTGQLGYASGGLYRSSDGGQNWSAVIGNTVLGALALSPDFSVDRTVWAYASSGPLGTGILVSTNGGDGWTPLTTSVHADVIIPSPNYAVDQTLFAGTGDSGLQKSSDGGQHWTQVLPGSTTALAVSPAFGASRTVYAGVRAAGDAPGEIYRSTDGGNVWQKLNTSIPATRQGYAVHISVLNFAADGSVLAGVSYGNGSGGGAAYRSADGGQTWQSLSSGLSTYNLFDLTSVSNRSDSTLHGSPSFYAGTDGGLWQIGSLQGDPTEPGTWDSHGPRGGRAQVLAVSPGFVSDGLALSGEWVMGRSGDQSGRGILKSTNWGSTWQASAQGTEAVPYPYSSAVHGYAFSPNFAADRTVFAATWGGLFKSNDAGESWQWLPRATLGAPGSFAAVAVAPDYPTSGHVLAAGGWGGLFMSRDSGIHWTPNYSLSAISAIVYSPDFALDNVAFAGGFGVHKTSNKGISWTQVLTQPVSALVISPQFGADHTVIAGGDALYISTNAGSTWISTTLATGSPRVSALAISPAFADDHTLFAGANSGLYRSGDGGVTWQPVASYPSLPVLSLAISPGWPQHPILLAGTAQGVYRTVDGGATWTRMEGLAVLSTSPIALSSDEALMLTGTSNGVHASDDDGHSWFSVGLQELSSLISDVAISPAYTSDRTLFAAWNSSVSIGASIYRTTNGGANWQPVFSTDSVGALAISPQYATDHTIYATGRSGRVIRSSDGGDSWPDVGVWPSGISYPARRVALPPNYPADSTVFAAGLGFWRLPSGATTWEPATSGLLTDTTVLDIAVAPNYTASQTLLAVASWSSNFVLHYGVFRSTDGGVNWQPASIGLPDVELRSVAFSPSYAEDRTAFVISMNQLFRSIDGGQSWTTIGSPPGSPTLSNLSVNGGGRVFVTSSAGVWRYGTVARDILVNGDFEAGSGWELPATPHPAAYSQEIVYTGRQSKRVGIDTGSNVYAFSSARQTVTIPISLTSAQLSVRLYPVSGESQTAIQNQAMPLGKAVDAPRTLSRSDAAAGDAQYVLVLEPGSGAILRTLFWGLSNAQVWQRHMFDLTPYAGQTIVLHFGVYNDSAGGQTAMVVDNASLAVIGPLPFKQYLPVMLKGYAGSTS